MPNYYENFKCIADRCKHNCCIGWEIDIDSDTLAFYRSLPSPLGEKLKSNISLTETPHFILAEHERCPFLNSENLCELITAFGDAGLCQICADHPRFFNEYSDRIEVGLGLCCEAAGALILSQKQPVSFQSDNAKEKPTKKEHRFFNYRDQVLCILQNRTIPLYQRIDDLKKHCGIFRDIQPLTYWAEIFRSLERLDPAWENYIDRLDNTPLGATKWETAYEQFAVYMVYRHLFNALNDNQFEKWIGFIILSLQILCNLTSQAKKIDEIIEVARLYSSEIEYSDQNIKIILSHIK